MQGLPSGPARQRDLDAETMPTAVREPAAFRAAERDLSIAEGRVELSLAPYAIVRIDAG